MHKNGKKYEEDDTVAVVSRTRGLRIGLINEIFSDNSDDDDTDDESDDTSLKPGQIRVEWYPTGKETVTNSEKVKLVDRVLLLGEIVRPVDNLKKIGFISNVSVCCDVMLLPYGQFVLKNIDNFRVNFVQKYGDYNSEPKYVLYENWVGSVSNFSQTLILRSQRGYRCVISTSDDSYDLSDASLNRVEDSTFDDKQWYEGQTVKSSFAGLKKARWLSEPKPPPDHFCRRIAADWNANHVAKFTVEKIELESLNVHWISPIVGFESKMDVPDISVKGEELKKIKLINRFEHQFLQIGDRLIVDILPSDNVVPFPEWREMLRDEIMGSAVKKENTSINEHEQNEASCQINSSLESLNCEPKDHSNSIESVPPDEGDMWSDCDSETSERTEKDISTKPHKVSAARSNNVTLKWLKKIKTPVKNDRPPAKKRKASITDQHKCRTISNEKRFQPGQTCFVETVFVRSSVDIIWQDGTTSANVPTSQLAYAEVELDEHVFFPGSFVLQQEESDRSTSSSGYGVVESIDVDNRVANVSWYEISKNENGFNCPKLTNTDKASVYDLIVHPDFIYPSGSLVMRIENLKVIGIIYVGQVLYTTKNGLLYVQWMSGEYENVFPQEICKLTSDEPAWSEHSDNLSDDESAADSDDSWSTIDDSNDNASSGDEEGSVSADEEVETKVEGPPCDCKKQGADSETFFQRLKGLLTKVTEPTLSSSEDTSIAKNVESCSKDSLAESISRDSPTAPLVESQLFEIIEEPPSSHMYCQEPFIHDATTPKFIKAVRHELKVLQSSLAADIFVKTYERRMDLFSVMIRGSIGTPYVNGLFLFDIRLKPSYPHDPPLVYYRAFASEQLNPNLYQDGKVCVSLLGTWSGKDSEVWNPGSNLLQVLVSIQGLILNAQPYFNEAGYEARRALPESVEKSRCYNEMALIRSLENLVNMASSPPGPFEKEIYDHMRCRGQGLIEQVRSWMDNTNNNCEFPLQPISLGCRLSANKQLTKLEQLLAQKFTL